MTPGVTAALLLGGWLAALPAALAAPVLAPDPTVAPQATEPGLTSRPIASERVIAADPATSGGEPAPVMRVEELLRAIPDHRELSQHENRRPDPAPVARETRPAPRPAEGPGDPLRGALRSLVNVSPATGGGGTADAGRGRPAEPVDRVEIPLSDEARAAILDTKEALANVVRSVLDPKVGADGKVSFSFAGVDGIQVSADGREMKVSVGDTSLGSVQYSAGRTVEPLYQGGALAGTPGDSRRALAAPVSNPIQMVLDLISEIFEHPLTWLVIGLVIIGRIAFVIVQYSAARAERKRLRVSKSHAGASPLRSHGAAARVSPVSPESPACAVKPPTVTAAPDA